MICANFTAPREPRNDRMFTIDLPSAAIASSALLDIPFTMNAIWIATRFSLRRKILGARPGGSPSIGK